MFKIIKIIGGDKKGFSLKTKVGTSTRPTLNRVRENIFNILQSVMPNSLGLDLFAGSGAVGIEALSRGAQAVTFVEKDKVAFAVIRENLKKTNYLNKSFVFPSSWHIFLKKTTEVFDWIFVDPPYGLDVYHEVIEAIGSSQCLSEGGIIILETDKAVQVKSQINGFICYRKIRYGNTIIWFYKEM
ncbi:hypothetical protein AZF37_04540 [endosymbiont 'TC1' of Trimyema compressum]|uniref:16S rRNA (guanine(966)-N(2))-methyltransferase RsmD n=1 Tax=endosymbiont 'TC1' of Trimyema compressum TaxID=243899 RepID=UPI0007F118F6|nr:16S rRNA (guanine(966)-N(2))-methyltransferase RsmD [endosymbiont 'TC1' of Trimyema compressum]AMP20535.1 hypothetical protein AZF37_04540 [endosymbiont 'TC1' of Trimyema compressum]